jgi:pimeloyl-ACP methyl ester carboxylesterase
MSPFYFGTTERRLFGIYEAARGSAAKGAAVLCYPWGSEYVHAHRSLRQLSSMLNAAGIHTLRFDYHGTGDSAGDMTDVRLMDWEADIQTAMTELRDITNATQVALVGLRLGGALAAKVASRTDVKVSSLVLWDPVLDGEEYISELHCESRTGAEAGRRPVARPAELGGGHEILGFPMTHNMAREIRNIDMISLVPALPERSLMIVSHSLASHVALRRACDQRPGTLAIEAVADQRAWVEWPLGHPRAGTAPAKVLQQVVGWLT